MSGDVVATVVFDGCGCRCPVHADEMPVFAVHCPHGRYISQASHGDTITGSILIAEPADV